MANKYRYTSYSDRKLNPAYKVKVKYEKMSLKVPVKKEQYNETLGKTIPVTDIQVMDNVKKLSRFKVNDFALENLQAIGFDNLNPSSLSRSTLGQIDSVERTLQRMSNTENN